MARKALSKKTRFEVFKRDGFRCVYCGANPSSALLQIDHAIPVAAGGGNDMDNLVTACQPCNLGKSANSLDDVPRSMADRAAEVKEREAQIAGYAKVMADRRDRIEDNAWDVARIHIQHFSKDGIRKTYLLSIKQFLEKLPVDEMQDAMEIAVSKKPYSEDGSFRYFCGICWNKLKRSGLA